MSLAKSEADRLGVNDGAMLSLNVAGQTLRLPLRINEELGAGGAARGALLPLLEQQPAALTLANRTHAKAQELALQFAEFGTLDAAEFTALQGVFDVIINATSASLDADVPPLPASVFSGATLAYDMMYGKQPTVFMEFAQRQGAVTRDGLGMLVEQAAEAFLLWRGVRPETSEVFHALRRQLSQ